MDLLAGELARLAEPIAPDSPCGESLEDTPALAAFDAYRVFGQLTASANEPDWRELRSRSLETLEKSKDFRVLAHLMAAALRVDSLQDVLRVFPLVDTWLTRYWDEVYPRIDDDAIMRRNALASFADRVAIVDGLRRLPFVKHPQLGSFSLRDFDIATGVIPNPDTDSDPPSEGQINAALTAADFDELEQLRQLTAAASRAMSNVEETMRSKGGGPEAVPRLDTLIAQLNRIQQVLGSRTVQASGAAEGAAESGNAGQQADVAPVQAVGAVKSRQDAMRALDAVANYFRRNEPSSPVPLIVERAKRLVTMNFLEVLEELAPEGVDQAKRAAGVRDQD